MPDITITLTGKEKTVLDAILGAVTLENYVKGKIKSHDTQKVDAKWNKKTLEEKEVLVP